MSGRGSDKSEKSDNDNKSSRSQNMSGCICPIDRLSCDYNVVRSGRNINSHGDVNDNTNGNVGYGGDGDGYDTNRKISHCDMNLSNDKGSTDSIVIKKSIIPHVNNNDIDNIHTYNGYPKNIHENNISYEDTNHEYQASIRNSKQSNEVISTPESVFNQTRSTIRNKKSLNCKGNSVADNHTVSFNLGDNSYINNKKIPTNKRNTENTVDTHSFETTHSRTTLPSNKQHSTKENHSSPSPSPSLSPSDNTYNRQLSQFVTPNAIADVVNDDNFVCGVSQQYETPVNLHYIFLSPILWTVLYYIGLNCINSTVLTIIVCG